MVYPYAETLAVAERFGVSDSFKQTVSLDILDKLVYLFDGLFIGELPVKIIVPCVVRP